MDMATLIWWALVVGGLGAVVVIGISVAMVLANKKED